MTRKSDLSAAASAMARDQAARLRRLRRLATGYQADAAEAAGVSKDAWSRMELGQARMDAVALGRFALSYDVPAEYVITGRIAGFRDELLRRVVAAERLEKPPAPPPGADAAAASAGTAAHTGPARRSTRRKAGILGRPAKCPGSLL